MYLSILFIFLSFSAFCKVETHEIETNKSISIDVPEGWEGVKDLYGLPLVVLGPWANQSRPAMSFAFTGHSVKVFSRDKFQNLFKDFKTDKEEWVKEHNGELLSFEPMTEVKMGDNQGHFIGAEFKINDVHFIERSYYLSCKDETYNVKYSIRDEHRKYIKDLSKIVESLKCK